MLSKLSVMKYGIVMTKRGLLLNLILFSFFYTSYFVFSLYIPMHFIPSIYNRLIVQASFNFIIAITLLATSFFINRFNQLRVIYAYSILTSTLALLLFFASSDIFRLISIFVIAMLSGIGQLAFLTHFWNLTVSEERGRITGLIVSVSLLFNLIIYTVVAGNLDFSMSIALGIILSLGASAVVLLRPETAVLTTKRGERGNYFEKRTVLLYIVPWVLFSLINATFAKNISFHISQQVPTLYPSLTVLQVIATVLGALVGGATADFFGRRVSLAFSLTLYGISSALAGIVNNSLLYFVYVANGLSWGILFAMYIFVIWGDLANKENCAKMYSIGIITLYATQGMGLLPLQQTFQIPLGTSSLISCLLIFLSNTPIFLAPELLSSDFRERIKLKLHISAIKRIKQSRNQG